MTTHDSSSSSSTSAVRRRDPRTTINRHRRFSWPGAVRSSLTSMQRIIDERRRLKIKRCAAEMFVAIANERVAANDEQASITASTNTNDTSSPIVERRSGAVDNDAIDYASEKIKKLEKRVEALSKDREKGKSTFRQCCGCLFSCWFQFVVVIAILSAISSSLSSGGPLVPLVNGNMYTEHCAPIDVHSPTNISEHTYDGRRLDVYVEALHQHIVRQHVIGLTSYHIGLPLCILAYRDSTSKRIRTLVNPRFEPLHNGSAVSLPKIPETDVVCPNVGSLARHRYPNGTLEYYVYEQLVERPRHQQSKPTLYNHSVSGESSLIMQHLIDVLRGKSVCSS